MSGSHDDYLPPQLPETTSELPPMNKNGIFSFVRNSSVLIAIELGAKLLGLVLFVIIARYLGALDLGLYQLGITLSGLFVIGSIFGFERLVQKEIGRDEKLLYSHFKEINVIKLAFSFVSLLMLWLTLLLFGEERVAVLMLIGIFIFLQSFLNFVNALFHGIGRPEFEMLDRAVFSILNLGLGVTALALGWGLTGVIITQLISSIIALLLAMGIIEKIAYKVPYDLSFKNLWNHIRRAAPFAGIILVLYFGTQINVVILSILTDKESIGYFASALRIYDTFTLIPAAIMGAFLPLMSRLYMTSLTRLVQALSFTLKYLFILSIPTVLGTWVVGSELIYALYGEKFAPSGLTIKLLMTATIFNFWNFAVASLMVARNREKMLVWFFSIVAIVHITGNLILIPIFGHYGAAAAVIITEGLQFVAFSYYLRRYIRLKKFVKMISGPLACALVMAVISYLLVGFNLYVAISAAAVSYVVLLLITRSVKKGDLLFVRGELGRDFSL